VAHPAQLAADRLHAEVMQLAGNSGVRPGDTRWFELQAKGCALSMLRGMLATGAHESPAAAEAYRKSIHVKGLLNGAGEELGEVLHG
jgi:hypothetical protein